MKASRPVPAAPRGDALFPEPRGSWMTSGVPPSARACVGRMKTAKMTARLFFHMAPSKRRGPRPVRDGSDGGPPCQIDALSPSRGTDQAGSNWFARSRGLGGHSASSVARNDRRSDGWFEARLSPCRPRADCPGEGREQKACPAMRKNNYELLRGDSLETIRRGEASVGFYRHSKRRIIRHS